MPVFDDSITLASGDTLWTGSFTPGGPALTFALADTLVVGASVSGSIVNTGLAASGPWSIAPIAGLTITPASGSSIAAGATVSLTATASAAATYAPALTSAGAVITGSPQILVVTPAPSIVLSASGTAVAGQEYTITVTAANLTGPLVVTPENVASTATFNPTTATPAPGDLVKLFGATWASAGAKQIRARAPGGIVSNTLSVNVAVAPPTTATLSGSASAVAAAAQTYTVALNAVADQTYTITWAVTGGTAASGASTITSGNATASVAVTFPSAGSGSVDFAISPSLTRVGRPRGVTVSGAAPPPPAPGATITSPTLLTAGAGTYPYTIGQGFRPGDLNVAALAGLQVDAKSFWPDGSVKIALISGILTATGASTVVALGAGDWAQGAALTAATIRTSGMAVAFTSGLYGSVTWAASSTDWEAPFINEWAIGPVCFAAIYRKPFPGDVHLTAWMEVRVYSTGDIEVFPWIENGYLTVASPNEKPDIYGFSIDGVPRFSQLLPMYHHTRVPLLTGTALSYWRGTDKTVTPKVQRSYLYSTGLVQSYMSTVEQTYSSTFDGVSASNNAVSGTYTPGQVHQGSVNTIHPTVMGAAGGADSIGVQPAWEVIALVDTSKLAHDQMIRESFRFGHYQIHYRDENTNRPIRFSQRAGLQIRIGNSFTNAADTQDFGLTQTPAIVGGKTASPDGNPRNYWKTSHQPASPVLAYLTTGRFWFMEECQHIAGMNFLLQAGTRAGTQYHRCEPSISPTRMQLREAAWTFRNLVNAATVTPDDDPLKADFDASVDSNIEYYHGRYIAPYGSNGMNPLGLIENIGNGTTGGNQAWQFDFWFSAWARAIALRAGTSRALRIKARAFVDWTSRSVVGRLGGTGSDEFFYRFATTSALPYASSSHTSALWPGTDPGTPNTYSDGTYPNWAGGTGPWYLNWGQFYDRRIVTDQGYTGGKVDGDTLFGAPLEPTNWWGALNEAICLAVSLGAPGATAAYARLAGNYDFSNYWLRGTLGGGPLGGSAFQGQRPVNATIPAATALPQENFTSLDQAAGTRINAGLNDAYAVDFERATGLLPGNILRRWWLSTGAVDSGNVFQDAVQAYSGSTWAEEYGRSGALIINGGSDGASVAQVAYIIDFDTLTWKQVGAPRNLPPDGYWCNTYPAGAGGNVWELQPASGPRVAPQTDQRDTVWFDYLWHGSLIKFANHTVLQNTYVPESLGGGKNGSLWMPYSSYSYDRGFPDPRTGTLRTWTPHVMNLHTGVGRRAIAAPANGVTTGDGYDQPIGRRIGIRAGSRLWYFTQGSANAIYHDLTSAGPPYATASYTIPKVSGGSATYTVVYCSAWIHVPEANALVGIYPTNSNDIQAAVPPSGQVGVQVYTINGSGLLVDQERADFQTRLPIATYAFPKGGVFVGVTWVPASVVGGVGKFYIYEGYGDTSAYTLTPSSLDFASCTFTWGREDFTNGHTGADPVFKAAYSVSDVTRSGVQGKWQYVPALGRIAWHDGPNTLAASIDGVPRRGVIQLWRPPGTPI